MKKQSEIIKEDIILKSQKSDFDNQDNQFLIIQRILIDKLCLDYNIFIFEDNQISQTSAGQHIEISPPPPSQQKGEIQLPNNNNIPKDCNDSQKNEAERGQLQQLNKSQENQKIQVITNGLGLIVVKNEEQNLTHQLDRSKENLLNIFLERLLQHIIGKDNSQIIIFFTILVLLFLLLCVFGPITLLILFFYLIKDKSSLQLLLKIICLLILPIILMSFSVFFFFFIFGSKQEEFDPNNKMFLVNIQCFMQLIYIFFVLASYIQAVIFFQFKMKEEGQEICKTLGIDMQRMQVEFIDRRDTDDFFQQKDKLKILKHFRSTKFQCFTLLNQMEESDSPFRKNWNSAIELLNSLPLTNLNFRRKYNWGKKVFQLILIIAYVYIVIQFKAGVPTNSQEKWRLAAMVINCFSYSVMLIVFQVLPKVVESELEIFKGLTALLEISNQNSQADQVEKQSSTLNLYCQYTVQSWASLHRLAIQLTHCFFKYLNVLQFIDILIIISLVFILALDFYGNAWQKYFLYNDRQIFIAILLNIGFRVVFTLFPIFTSFSECAEILNFNKIQIRAIMRNLQRIRLEYYTLKAYLKNFTQFHLQDLKINEIKDKDIKTIYNRIKEKDFKTQLVGKESEYQPSEETLKDLIAVYEINRNSQLYSHGESNLNQIQQELNYLNQLIKAYKYIHADMVEVKQLYTLKFLGLFEVSYAEAQALLFIIIPAIASMIIQRLFDPNG